ncbi:MAG: 3-oxoacyl-ACP synthase [Brumimicrobium sp.]
MDQLKKDIIDKMNDDLSSNYQTVYQSYIDAKDSRDNDTKSSAGDKFETGRAMMQQEIDHAEKRLAQIKALKNELFRLPVEEKFEEVIPGSLVKTTNGIYFIGVSLGKFQVGNEIVFAISTASPLGQLLHLKKVGTTLVFNGSKQTIEWIK